MTICEGGDTDSGLTTITVGSGTIATPNSYNTDSTFVFDSTDQALDAGIGNDVLVVNSNEGIDFSAISDTAFSISNIETIDLSYSVFANDISNLTLEDVLDITDGDNELRILGDSNDSVQFATGDGWSKGSSTVSEDGYNFDVYTNSNNSSVSVKVETTVVDSIA